jgi:hypothetical protein
MSNFQSAENQKWRDFGKSQKQQWFQQDSDRVCRFWADRKSSSVAKAQFNGAKADFKEQ